MKKTFIIILIIFILILFWAFLRFVVGGPEDDWICVNNEWVKHGAPAKPAPTTGCGKAIASFADCVKAGQPVMESYPRQCRANNQTFAEDIGNELEKMDIIRVDFPRPNQKIASPLAISGQARGNWFFEASFPVKLYDSAGNLLATAIAQAQSEWMTEDFVVFTAIIEFAPIFGQGRLVLEKDNPSGLPENNDQLDIPVDFE